MVKVTLRGIFSHLLRLGLTVLAVIVSVAFMSGTQVLTATITSSFDKVFDDVYKNIDVVVRSSDVVDTGFGPIRNKIDDRAIADIKKVQGVQAVEGQVLEQLAILDKNGEALGTQGFGPPTFGLNWLTEASLNGWHIADGRPPTGPNEVFLDTATAKKGGYVVGDTVRIQLNKGAKTFTVVGIGGFGATDNYAGASAALFETSTAQQLLLEPGKFDFINVSGAPGTSQPELRNRIAKIVPKDAEAITGASFTKENQDIFAKFFGFLGTVLFVFGVVAMFVGAFIIYNTFSIIVAQRTRELALLRAMGAGRRQVLLSVTLEAVIVGATSSLLGVLGGILLATGLTGALNASGGGVPTEGLTYKPAAFISSFLVGTIVTVLAGLFPAWKASRVPPVAAMRDVAIDTSGRSVWRLFVGVVLTTIGAILLYVGLFAVDENGLTFVGIGVPLVFLGITALGPLFAAPLSRALGAPLRSFTGAMATSNAMRNPRRTATTASALMIGVGLVVMFSILTQSVRASATSAIDTSFTVDYIVDSQSFGQTGLDPSLSDRIKAIKGVDAAPGIELGFAQVKDKSGTEKPTTALGANLPDIAKVMKIDVKAGSLEGLTPDQVAVSKPDADANNWTVGTPLQAKFLVAGAPPVTVGAVYSMEAQFGGGGLLMSIEGFAKRFPAEQQIFNQIYVKLAPLTDATTSAAAKDQIKAIIKQDFPTAKVQDISEFKDAQLAPLTVLLFIITVMLVLAIFIAILGIVNTLLLSVYERTREIGLLRAVGMSRGQVRGTVRWESVIFSLQGTVIGTGIGFAFAWALVRAIGKDNAITFAVPWGLLIAMVILAMIAGVVAAVIPAFTASRLNVLDAIATE